MINWLSSHLWQRLIPNVRLASMAQFGARPIDEQEIAGSTSARSTIFFPGDLS